MADTINVVDPDPPPPPPEEVAVTSPTTAIPVDSDPPPQQGCFSKKSGLEKALVIIVIIIVIILLGFVIAFLINFFFSNPPQGTCLTDDCVKSASRLKGVMDESKDPCNNFYEYACNGWFKTQVLSPGKPKVDMDSQMKEDHLIKLKALFEAEIDLEENEFSKKPKIFYKSCMNKDQLNKLATQPFLDLLDKVGKFPSIDSSWNETDLSLQDTLEELAKLSIMPLFRVEVKQDEINREKYKLFLNDAQLALDNREYYLGERDSKILSDYQQWMVNTLVLLGADVNDAEEDAENVVDFEISLAKMMRSDSDKMNLKTSYKTYEIDTLQVKLPWVEWLKLFQKMTKTSGRSIGVYIEKDEIIINLEPSFMEEIGTLLEKTPKRVLANYLMSRLLPLTAHLGDPFISEMDEYSKNILGKESTERWRYCAQLATDIFAEPVSRMFVEKHFSKDAKDDVSRIVSDIKNVYRQQLSNNDWMADKTKEKALTKLTKMRVRLGYPAYLYNDEKLIKLFKDISTNEETFMKNMLSARTNTAYENIKNLRKAPDQDRWIIQPTSLDGHYNQKRNEMILPAAFLQPPVYSKDFASAMNYAGVASIFAREITRGFDPTGKKYDEFGKTKSWWTERDESGYESRSSCFLDQWGCYKWDGISMNGETTLHENIAYNAGLKHSYKAYEAMIERRGSEEMRLPGIKLDNHQIFFLSYAQMWCAKYGDDAKKQFLSSSLHPPYPYRVFGTLQNSKEFSEAFQCSVGTRMNPMQKCNMW